MGSATIQGDLWGARAREWAELQEGSFGPLYEAAFGAARVGTDTLLLDVGCGAGLALEMAQARGAKVSGLDAAAGLVGLAKDRCAAADIRVGDVEELPFANGTFDVTTGFNSFQYAADPVHALAEAKRVTKANGYVLLAVWGAAEKCELAPSLAAPMRGLGYLRFFANPPIFLDNYQTPVTSAHVLHLENLESKSMGATNKTMFFTCETHPLKGPARTLQSWIGCAEQQIKEAKERGARQTLHNGMARFDS